MVLSLNGHVSLNVFELLVSSLLGAIGCVILVRHHELLVGIILSLVSATLHDLTHFVHLFLSLHVFKLDLLFNSVATFVPFIEVAGFHLVVRIV